MNLEHRHIKQYGHQNQTYRPGPKMPEPQPRRYPQITQQKPKLPERSHTHRGDSEQPDPLTADDRTERKSSERQPRPPAFRERLVLVFVAEASPEEDGEGGEEDEGRIKEDVSGLGDHAIFEGYEHGGEEGGCGSTVESAEGEVGEGDGGDS